MIINYDKDYQLIQSRLLLCQMVKHIQEQNRQLINKVQDIIANQPQNTRYQNWLIVFLLLLSFSLSFKKQSIEYFFVNPFFKCSFTDKLVNQNDACTNIAMCTLQNPDTLTAKMNLYCGSRKKQRNLIQSLRGIGGWVGTLSVGIIADVYGRKVCMVISLISLNLSFIFLIVGAWTNHLTFFMISEILEGVGNKFIFSISLIFMTRFLRKDMYQTITNAWYIVGGGFSHICLAIANHFITDWFKITLISSIPLFILLIATPYFIKEDPIYLFQAQKQQQFRTVVAEIQAFNGIPQNQMNESLKKVDVLYEKHHEVEVHTKKARTFKQICHMMYLNKALFFHTIALGIIHLSCDITLTGIIYSLQEVGYSYNVNIVIMGVSQMLGSATMIKILRLQPQRKRGFIIVTFTALILAFMLLFPFIYTSKIAQSIIIFLIKYLLACVFAFLVRVEVDSLPQKYQVSLFSLIQVFSVSHGVIGPSIIQFGVDHHMNNIVFTHVLRFIFGTLLILFISEGRHEVVRQSQDQNVNNQQKQVMQQIIKDEELKRQ